MNGNSNDWPDDKVCYDVSYLQLQKVIYCDNFFQF